MRIWWRRCGAVLQRSINGIPPALDAGRADSWPAAATIGAPYPEFSPARSRKRAPTRPRAPKIPSAREMTLVLLDTFYAAEIHFSRLLRSVDRTHGSCTKQ